MLTYMPHAFVHMTLNNDYVDNHKEKLNTYMYVVQPIRSHIGPFSSVDKDMYITYMYTIAIQF